MAARVGYFFEAGGGVCVVLALTMIGECDMIKELDTEASGY